jgi:hypothetical protein
LIGFGGPFGRKIKLILIWIIGSVFLTVYYSNCESYSSSSIQGSGTSQPPEEVEKSCEQDPYSQECIKEKAQLYELHKGFIYLTIAGSNTIQLGAYDNAINVSGTCYQYDFKKSEIYFRLVNDANSSYYISNNPNKNFPGSNVQCVSGNWGFSMNLNENEVTYTGITTKFQKAQSHTLYVEMIVRDETNTLYQNPSTAVDAIGIVPAL